MEALVHLVQEVVADQDLDLVHQGGTEAHQHIHLFEELLTLVPHPGQDHDPVIVINIICSDSGWIGFNLPSLNHVLNGMELSKVSCFSSIMSLDQELAQANLGAPADLT